jgi:hypothetical protein
VTGAITMIADLTIAIETINTTIVLVTTVRTLKAAISTKRRMIAGAIISQKRATRPCTMTSPLCRARAVHPEKGAAFAQDLLCAFVLGLALSQAAGATKTIM